MSEAVRIVYAPSEQLEILADARVAVTTGIPPSRQRKPYRDGRTISKSPEYRRNRDKRLRLADEWARTEKGKRNKERQLRLKREVREQILDALGPRCVQCGFADRRALQIDHVHNDGAEERRALHPKYPRATATKKYYLHILCNIGSGRYQVLCANCNWVKAKIGASQDANNPPSRAAAASSRA